MEDYAMTGREQSFMLASLHSVPAMCRDNSKGLHEVEFRHVEKLGGRPVDFLEGVFRRENAMSDIFISYKREDQATARQLANALESEGWTVWWDPKLRAGEHFDDVIEAALNEAKCVIVMWSIGSVKSRYVRDEAMFALDHNKLVPVTIQNVKLPFRFRGVHTLSLLDWDGSKDSSEFRRLVEDISAIVGPPAKEHPKRWPTERQGPLPERALERSESSLESGAIFYDKLKDGSQGPDMVVIPAGTFRMGDIQGDGEDSEKPLHPVTIFKPFAMGRYEVTFEEYDRFAAAADRELPGDKGWGRDRQPVINVSWNDAVAYTERLSHQTANRYRLPTEAEWEYAARAGTETAYWWGNEMKSGMANCDGGGSPWGGKQTSPVGSFQPNPFGLYDTAGNVLEWIQDCWFENYEGAPENGSAWGRDTGGNCARRVVRGGAWYDGARYLRSSARNWGNPGVRSRLIGFRVVQDIS